MDHFGRWLKANAATRLGDGKLLIGVLGTEVLLFALIPLLFSGSGPAVWGLYAVLLCVLIPLLWLPNQRFANSLGVRKAFRSEYRRFQSLHISGKLQEELGERAEPLEDAAKNWETIRLLVDRRPLADGLGEEIRKETDRRMDRVFDLLTMPAAQHGLSREAAAIQVANDREWLDRASRAMEDATLTGQAFESLGNDPLVRLRALASEQEEALAELRA